MSDRCMKMESIFKPETRTLSILINKENGIRSYKCYDRMFDDIVIRAQRTVLFK